MKRICTATGTPFEVTDEDLAFYDQVSPVFNEKKYSIPPPTLCPEARQQQRLAIANERHLYQDTCHLCKKPMLTEHPPYTDRTIYCRSCWYGDGWDPLSYGKEIDFDRPFFEQFNELVNEVPRMNLLSEGTNINSEYIHYAGFAKNCYLIMHADFCEDCYYGYGFKKNTCCVDGFYNLHCELCYDSVDVHKSYGLIGCQDCINCRSSQFLRDCIGCQDCFLCTGLRNKQYCFENEQLTEAEYKKKTEEIDLGSYRQYQDWKQKRFVLEKNHTFRAYQGHNLQNSNGNHLYNCKDTHESFDCEDNEGGKFCYQVVTGAKNNYDIYQYGLNLQESYECNVAGNDCYHILFTHNAHVSCNDLLYCWFAVTSKHCFGCVNIHQKQHCILNKQYSEDEYNNLAPKLIEHMQKTGEWGQPFPAWMSPFGYNKTTAQMYYPLTEKQAKEQRFHWDNQDVSPPDVEKIIPAKDLPDNIDDMPDAIADGAIICEETGKAFRITKKELDFYRQIRVPIPRRSPDQRHMDRFVLRNPRKFWNRPCDKCGKEIRTTYDPNQSAAVYCEECYKKAVY